ncbi:MAG: thioredoxin-like negative regulator of GroEL [Cellvibrionaceae bacterium]
MWQIASFNKQKPVKNAGKLEQAAELLDEILKVNPQNDAAWVLAAEIIHGPDKRREYLSNALKRNLQI